MNCEIPLPANPLTGLNGISPNMTVPTPAGTEKYTFSPVVNHIALNGKIGTTVTTKPGYVFPGGLTSKVFAATPDNTGYVFFSQTWDTTSTCPTCSTSSTLASTPRALLVHQGPTDDRQRHQHRPGVPDPEPRRAGRRPRLGPGHPLHRRAAGQRRPGELSRPFEFDVWHNVVSGADVPDDLTLDYGFELA